MTPAALAIVALIDALVRLPERGPKAVAAATGAELREIDHHPTWIRFGGASATGPFRKVELRADKRDSSGMIILEAPAAQVTARELDLAKYGARRAVAIAPPQASRWSERYSYEGFDLAFSFAVGSDALLSVVLTRE